MGLPYGGGRPGDVDLVVFVGSDVGVDDVVLRIMEVVEERVGLEADVYLISDPSRANCFLVWEALRHGRIIYQDGIGRELLVRAINVCYDFMLSRIKLNYTETLVVGWSGMLHNRLLEVIAVHTELLDKMRSRGIHWDDVIDLYAVLHALQVHAQAIIDYLLHTCALVGISAETPIHYIDELSRSNMISRGDVDLLKRIVRFRNIVVHEYGAIDMERVRGHCRIAGAITRVLTSLGVFTINYVVWALLTLECFCITLFLFIFYLSLLFDFIRLFFRCIRCT